MFRRRDQRMDASQEEPQEPGHVEGPYEVDNFAWGNRRHGELKDLLNTRHQEGFDLVPHYARWLWVLCTDLEEVGCLAPAFLLPLFTRVL